MTEGWSGDDISSSFRRPRYQITRTVMGIAEMLPGYDILGLIGWDDFLVRDGAGATFRLPTVPCHRQHLEPLQAPDPASLVADSRFKGKNKWYLTPIVFGGDPNPGSNLTWVDHDKHAPLVRWWNAKYRELSANKER